MARIYPHHFLKNPVLVINRIGIENAVEEVRAHAYDKAREVTQNAADDDRENAIEIKHDPDAMQTGADQIGKTEVKAD